MMAIYGYPDPIHSAFRKAVVEEFHFVAAPDAQAFRDGDVFDLGGGVRIRVLHAPGHTRGHSFFWIEPDDVLYLGDIDLSSFGPYYGDAWSELDDFERTLAALRPLAPRHWATFHHVGVLDERDAFLARLDRFEAVIGDRERRLVAYLRGEPRIARRDRPASLRLPRPRTPFSFADPVETPLDGPASRAPRGVGRRPRGRAGPLSGALKSPHAHGASGRWARDLRCDASGGPDASRRRGPGHLRPAPRAAGAAARPASGALRRADRLVWRRDLALRRERRRTARSLDSWSPGSV